VHGGLQDQLTQLLVPPDQLLQPVHRDHQDRPGLGDYRGGEHPLAGKDVQFGDELTRADGRQRSLNPGLVINDGYRARQDHEEVVAAIPLAEQHLPGGCRPDLTVTAQQRQLLGSQTRGQKRIGRRQRRRLRSQVITGLVHRPSSLC
jgi:hypothetical protein